MQSPRGFIRPLSFAATNRDDGDAPIADFAQTIATAYAAEGAALDLGGAVHDGAIVPEAVVKLPLRMVNRHGLIAGATGTGKTKTLQGIAEQIVGCCTSRVLR